MRDPVKGKSQAGRAREERAHATRRRIVGSATELFVAHGYAPTSVNAIARRAAVSPATIYQAFGTKQAVLERALDVVTAGDDAPISVLDRPWVDEARQEPDPRRRLDLVVRGVSTIAARAAPLMEVLRDAAAVEPEMRALVAERYRRRHESQSALVGLLAADRPLRSGLTHAVAADVFFALVGHDIYQLLVVGRGWTISAWQDWLVEAVERELFDDTAPNRGLLSSGPKVANAAPSKPD